MRTWLPQHFYQLCRQYRLPRLCTALFALTLSTWLCTSLRTSSAADTKPREPDSTQAPAPPQQENRTDKQTPPPTPDVAKKTPISSTSNADRVRDAIEDL